MREDTKSNNTKVSKFRDMIAHKLAQQLIQKKRTKNSILNVSSFFLSIKTGTIFS